MKFLQVSQGIGKSTNFIGLKIDLYKGCTASNFLTNLLNLIVMKIKFYQLGKMLNRRRDESKRVKTGTEIK